jgi:hypothetical protein
MAEFRGKFGSAAECFGCDVSAQPSVKRTNSLHRELARTDGRGLSADSENLKSDFPVSCCIPVVVRILYRKD